jgi:hypothetical protein
VGSPSLEFLFYSPGSKAVNPLFSFRISLFASVPPSHEHVTANNSGFLRLPTFPFIATIVRSSNGETKVEDEKKGEMKQFQIVISPAPAE